LPLRTLPTFIKNKKTLKRFYIYAKSLFKIHEALTDALKTVSQPYTTKTQTLLKKDDTIRVAILTWLNS